MARNRKCIRENPKSGDAVRARFLDLFFTQSLDGFFFAMFDEPLAWASSSDKEDLLDYAWHHLRVTRVNQAFVDQYLATEEKILGWTPADFFGHDIQAGRQTLTQLFDNGHLHMETHERRIDGTPILIEGDYICLYDSQRRIIGHFGIQRDVTGITAAVRALADSEAQYRLLVENQTDLTERKLAELALQKSEELFRTAMDAAQVGTWDWNIQTGEIIWSETLEKLMGLAPNSFTGGFERVQAMIYPEDRERVAAAIRSAIDEDADYYIEFRFVRPDGSVRWALGKGDVIRDEQGHPLRMTGVDIDITERKHTELQLQESEARFRNVTANLPGAVFRYRLDADGTDRITLMNQGCLDIWEITPEQVAESPSLLWEMVHDEDRIPMWNLVQQSAETLTPWYCEWRITTPSGQLKWLQGMGRPERSPSGDVVWDTLILDVSDRKKAELALTQASRQLQSFLDNTPAMVALFSADGRYLKVNRAGAALFGLTPEDMAGRAFSDFLPPGMVATFMARTAELIASQTPMVVEDQLCIEEHKKVLQSILFPVTVETEEPLVLGSISTDVTLLVEAQTMLRRQAEEERLMRTMIHHIRESLDLHQVLQTTVNEVRAFLDTDRVLVYRFHADWSGDMFVESVVPPWPSVLGSTIKDPCFEGDLVTQYLNGRISQIDHVEQSNLAQCHKDLLINFQVQANLTIPINCRGQLWGLLCVHQCEAPRSWRDNEIRLLRQISIQVAIAIQQAELYQQAQTELAQRKRLESQLRYEAFHDRLTTLPNRAFFLEQLSSALAQLHQNCQERSKQDPKLLDFADDGTCRPYQFAVLFLDLDRFKIINDSLGHTIGDTLLQIVAKRLQTCLGPGQTAARLGGDEFVVLLTGLTKVSEATDLALTIHNALEAPILLQQHEVFVRASIGIALSSSEYSAPDQLLRDADIAMYQAKDSNREYAIFDAPMHTLAVRQMQLENDLRHAIERQEFELHYQPIMALTSGRLQGFEALIRWRHPQQGLISPADFIPVAENTGLIADIDLWTLNQACLQMHQWHQQFPQHRELTVNVNLSGKQFVRADLIQRIDGALAQTGLQGHHLKLEITESVLIQNAPLAITILAQLKNRGITVCMDDFGTGYSSLSYLHRFPVDVLKIDKSFISGLQNHDSSSGDAEIIRAIISLATSLKLSVVAEGIETIEQLNYLKANHCQGGQGYYYSKPMTAVDVSAYLTNHP
jgi:diguanylate cyclase (GGDEF)-like protein/PAS domain S-box-containing protein